MSEPAKLTIEVISEGAVNKGMFITAQFNPKELAVTKSVPWNPNQEAGLDAPVMQFTAGQGEQLKIDLFFDTYEDASNVRDYTSKLRTLSLIDSGIHCPPLLMVTWGGDFSLKCVLESLNIRYTMFLADGTPVRATCSCGFKEALEAEEQTEQESPDNAKVRAVLRGDTLQSIAFAEYDDPAEWRRIADSNGIDDPADLRPGQRLLIPPILH